MSATLSIGQRVELVEKKLFGKIAYIGPVDPHPGIYYGLVLDEPKGKNNGSYKDKTYFNCAENHGIFVRKNQISSLQGDPLLTTDEWLVMKIVFEIHCFTVFSELYLVLAHWYHL